MDEEGVLEFVRRRVPSAWALELLLLLHREPSPWSREALVRELRGTLELVMQNLAVLISGGLAAETEDGRYAYRPQTPELAALVDGLAGLYTEKPITVLRTIFTTPSDRIRLFADTFSFRKPEE